MGDLLASTYLQVVQRTCRRASGIIWREERDGEEVGAEFLGVYVLGGYAWGRELEVGERVWVWEESGVLGTAAGGVCGGGDCGCAVEEGEAIFAFLRSWCAVGCV